MRYIVITPAKNEEKFIEFTLHSVVHQSLLPVEWIIIDDRSSDRTKEIALCYAAQYPWIKVFTHDQKETRSIGGNVVRLFNFGFSKITEPDYDFIVKLDADLTLPTEYFEAISKTFHDHSEIGICGGVCGDIIDDEIKIEETAEYHIRGAFKSYRNKCFLSIGGLKPVMGWDGIDEFTAMYQGWQLRQMKDLVVLHHRPTGRETGNIKYSYKMGKSCYYFGYDFILLTIRAIKRSKKYPFVFNGFAMFIGFIAAYLLEKRIVDANLALFIRRFQYKRIRERIFN